MLLNTSFDADRDEGSDCASSSVSVSNSAKIASSIVGATFSGIKMTLLISLINLSTRTARVKGSNSAASKDSVYSPFARFSMTKLPDASVLVVTSPGVNVTFTPSMAARVVRETTLPLTPPLFCAKTVNDIKDNTMNRIVLIFI